VTQAKKGLHDWFCFVMVSLYLGCVGLFLIVTRRIKPEGSLFYLIINLTPSKLRMMLRRSANRKTANGILTSINPELGYCYLASIPGRIVSDASGCSSLKLFENGKPLGPAHSLHDDIRNVGLGRYSHWSGYIYFSSSDNSDPRSNGRMYLFME